MSGPSKKELARVRELLLEGRGEQIAEGLDLCVALAAPAVAPLLVEALSRGILVGAERARGLSVLADLGLAYPLDDIRADGWLERLGEGVAGFREVCDILGRTFFGMSTLLGVQVTNLEVQPDDFQRSRVGFTLGDGRSESLTLREFKRRIVAAILEDKPELAAVELPLDRDRTITLLGSRHILLAALFDWSLAWVYFGEPPRKLSDVHIDALHGDQPVAVTLEVLVARLRQEVEDEWQRYLDPLGGIDADLVQRAAELLPTDPARAADLLGGLLRFVLDYGRQPNRSGPDRSVLALVCEGLALLGRAHVASEPEMGRYGEEVLRLGVQVFPGAPGVEHLHLALGEHLVHTAREGEALGHLRRAAALGASADAVEPLLVEALFRSERLVAAAVVYRQLAARAPRAAERVGQPILAVLKDRAAAVFRALDGIDPTGD
ncbi:MAG: hypothetical protein JXB32_25335 [Deltaproteobacteria bacterium]|nr:hypothetical protein [Deltaproteobacteria bacterium]